MKKIFILFLIFVSVLCFNAKSQTLKDSLLNIDLYYYLNKPIDSLLAVLPQSYDSIYTRAGGSTFVGATIILRYSNPDTWVYIYPGTHDFFTPLNSPYRPPHIAWPLHLVRKEKAWRIIIWGIEAEPLREICCGN